jgi:predicted lactoylglutathione lyase
MSRMIFVNLPVADLEKSKALFTGLGFEFDPMFSDERAASMIIQDGASYVMLLQNEFFKSFLAKDIADARATTEVTVCVSADSRAGVDELVDKALSLGASPASEPQDMGFMYGRSFYDLDGHHWEVAWMDVEAATQADAEQGAAQGHA